MLRKIPSFRALFLAICLVLCGSSAVQAATWYASSGATGSGSSAADPGDLETLVTASAAGDVLRLAAGNYVISVYGIDINHALKIYGAGMGSTVLDCTAPATCMTIDSTSITTSNTLVQSLTFQDGNSYQLDIQNGGPSISGVEFTGTISVTSLNSRNGNPIVRNSVFSASDTGFHAANPGAPKLITGCTFSNNPTYAIYLTGVESGVIKNNTFDSNYGGILLYGTPTIYGGSTSSVTVSKNTFSNNDRGVYLYGNNGGTGENTISQNRFNNNTYGVVSYADSTSVEESIIDSNKFTGNTTYALILDGTTNTVINNLLTYNTGPSIASDNGSNTIAFNTIARGTGDGIALTNSDQSLVVNNITFRNSGYGISLDGTSTAAELGSNDTYRNTSGTISGTYVDLGGNINDNPLFTPGSYELSSTSTLIDAATSTYTIGYDIEGNARVTPDIGAYEY